MELVINDYQFGARPDVTRPNPEILKILGESGVRKLVDDHYNLLIKSEFSPLFPQDKDEFEAAKLRSSDFFIQILGGPEYFNQNRGEPKLINRHANFKITQEARVVWLECYIQLLPKLDLSEELILSFWDYLNVFSIWMVNSDR